MITKYTNAYASLFATASQALKITESDKYISSLNEYFSVIEDLANEDLKFTMLPLDEEPFFIDANSREIKPSPSFPKNIVGVQGDQVAEIIYFKINRYFDATDLAEQDIYIEWENPAKEQGLSKEYVRDITSDPDYIIFGWPLASQITEHAGTVKYAIRFYKLKDLPDGTKEIIYSFSTQPSTIVINNTMDFNIMDDSIQRLEDNVLDMIKDRFQNSKKDNVDTDVPAPIFSLNLVSGEYDINTDDGYDRNPNSYALKAQAIGGNITYILKRSNPGSAVWTPLDKSTIKEEYFLTTDTERNPAKIYYTRVETDGVYAYLVYESTFDADSNENIYEKYCVAFVSSPGEYLIEAKNRSGISSTSLASNHVTFPKPEAPVIETGPIAILLDEEGKATLDVNYLEARPIGECTYNWLDKNGTIPDAVGDSYSVVTDAEESFYYVTVTNRRNNDSAFSEQATYRVTKPAQSPVILSHTEELKGANLGDTLTLNVQIADVPMDSLNVQWYRSTDPTIGDNDEAVEDLINIKDTGISEFVPTTRGYYYAIVYLTRNTDTKTATSGMWAVM